MDEKPGTRELTDISEKGINANLINSENNYEAIWGPELSIGEPLDYEDRWGAKADPGRSLKTSKESFIRIKGTRKLCIMASTFTMEMWVKIEDIKHENCILETSGKSLMVSITENTIFIANESNLIRVECTKDIKENTWTQIGRASCRERVYDLV